MTSLPEKQRTLTAAVAPTPTASRFYDDNAEDYASRTATLDLGPVRSRFLDYLPSYSRILDAGCGSGRDAVAFAEAGYRVDAIDESAGMVEQARLTVANSASAEQVRVQRQGFAQLEAHLSYEGVWACASLVHLNDAEVSDAMHRLMRALKPEGILYASIKKGTGMRRSPDGRTFNEFTLGRLLDALLPHGSLVEYWITGSQADAETLWHNVLLRKSPQQ